MASKGPFTGGRSRAIKNDKAIDFFKLSEKIQLSATKAMINCNGRKKLGKGYLREMGARIACYKAAISALEKQTPKVPFESNGKDILGRKTYAFKCPACGGADIGDYCQDCGQKIDWAKDRYKVRK